ncbi:MAG: 2-C-methyl-D-erythritol 4-phosphate cytidylyltransferase [Muribaculaceae bacterium]|nr:2-C-methyl-D-erythritol 4-phosphate cytidylyltransferase [Muribaculaceae bacterium]
MHHPDPSIVVIIVAAGTGSRFGASLPKQFCQLQGRPVLCSTIDAFRGIVPDDNIRVVISDTMEATWRQLCDDARFFSPHTIAGGETRWHSVKNAIDSLGSDCPDDTIVMIHDGARPFPSADLIRRLALLKPGYAGNVAAVALTDSIRELSTAGCSRAVDRAVYRAVQTPQSFRLDTLRQAYAQPFSPVFTDDASVVEAARLGEINLVEGDTFNMKITSPHDLVVAEAIANYLANRETNSNEASTNREASITTSSVDKPAETPRR